jgi:hypothetical protein
METSQGGDFAIKPENAAQQIFGALGREELKAQNGVWSERSGQAIRATEAELGMVVNPVRTLLS